MRASRRITTIAATALVAAVAFTGGTATVASASITGKDMGNGATLQAAEHDAYVLLRGDYYGCTAPYTYTSYGQNANGTWWAWIEAPCKGVN